MIAFVSLSGSYAQQPRDHSDPVTLGEAREFEQRVRPLLKASCSDCHDGDASEGEFSLSHLDWQWRRQDLPYWRLVHERIKFGEMPPADAPQLTADQRRELLTALRAALLKAQRIDSHHQQLRPPWDGNLVDHAALFDDEATVIRPAPPRVWRLRPAIYRQVHVGGVQSRESVTLSDPLNIGERRGFQDFASQYFVDEPTTQQLLSNADKIVRVRSRLLLDELTGPHEPSREAIRRAVDGTFLSVLHRQPTEPEKARFEQFYRELRQSTGKRLAAERLLIAIYLQPEALFREELGQGPPDEHGRVRLSQREIALAVSYALGNDPKPGLLRAADDGRLSSATQVAKLVRERLESPTDDSNNPRILQFFREYFDYPRAADVFKNSPPRGSHLPGMLINDLDLLIQHIVNEDSNVLFELLTTSHYVVDCERSSETGTLRQASLSIADQNGPLQRRNPEHATIYGLPRDWIWTDRQPVEIPRHMRAGVLTHPAWLVAWSGNFDNQPVQRGKWIRTHLLGGVVFDLPIGVDAFVPEDRTKQFRERITMATAGTECQRCHRKMDPLGLPLEQYDHYGRYRVREVDRPVNTKGAITLVDDGDLVGAVSDPIEMMHRLARSKHVEQVFVRHVFRYFMGRNETLGDALALREAHRAYRASGGSFRALVTSLLASDSFLYRSVSQHAEDIDD